MKPSFLAIIVAVALVIAIAYLAGLFPHAAVITHVGRQLNVCASTKQFLVEFRKPKWTLEMPGAGASQIPFQTAAQIAVDGEAVGVLTDETPVRRFLCEGNHEARIRFRSDIWNKERNEWEISEHSVEFAVSGPSVFHLYQWQRPEFVPSTCVTKEVCFFNAVLQLAGLDERDAMVAEQ